MEFLGWTVLDLNSLGGIFRAHFASFCLAAGEFFGWNFRDGSLLFHRCLGWNSVGGPCLLSCVGNPLGGISWVEVPCVACSWVEFFDQLLRWNFRGMFYAGKSSRWNFLVGRFWI